MREIQVFVPGKVMLAGEYAVLRGGHSLAVTLDIGMQVNLQWEPLAASWEIKSNLWPSPKIVNDDHTPQVDILCRAVQFAAKKTGLHGGTVSITSNLNVQHGLGSSAALRLGVCGAFFALQEAERKNQILAIPRESLNAAWQLQSESQGQASGYDVVTQYVGGLVEFNYDYSENKWSPHWFKHDLGSLSQCVHVFVGGRGAPTAQTMHTTESWLDSGGRLERLIDISENLVDAFTLCTQWPSSKTLKNLVAAVAASRSLFIGSPHFPSEVASLLFNLQGVDQNWSWKTTGAGGEDAILLVGEPRDIAAAEKQLNDSGWHRLESRFTENGARVMESSATMTAPTLDAARTPMKPRMFDSKKKTPPSEASR